MSERCYRFKPDALGAHAPPIPGVYEFVMFDEKVQPIVLFIGLALPPMEEAGTIHEALAGHLMGRLRPSADDLFTISRDIYFDYVASADVETPQDYKDIAGALIAKHRPRLNPSGPPPFSGRHGRVLVEEV